MSVDLSKTIAPKSDQLNADDLIARSMTIKITNVTGKDGDAQPISIFFEGDNGKPYKPCKSMRRVLVMVWGDQGKEYIGRSMTIYRDPAVVFGGIAVGGIRITHMSHIDKEITMSLTASKQSRKPYTVKPLVVKSGNDLAAEAPAFAKEIDLADTPEKLAMLEPRYLAICEKLMAADLPKWKEKLIGIWDSKCKEFPETAPVEGEDIARLANGG